MPETKIIADNSKFTGDHDRVVMASRRNDGTPAQTPDFEYIGDKDTAVEAAKVQLSQQAVSAADVEIRGATTATDDGNDPDPGVAEIVDAHRKAAAGAERQASAEVSAKFKG